MCCDGTLFGFVELASGEEVRLRAWGIEPIRQGGKLGFRQSCPAWSAAGCGCYGVRPATCRAYRCPTLIALEEGSIAADEAMARVRKTRQVVGELRRLVPDGETLPGAPADPKLLLLAGVASLLLDRFFRKDHQKQLQVERHVA